MPNNWNILVRNLKVLVRRIGQAWRNEELEDYEDFEV